MKWTYSIKHKLTASALLFSLCILVLLSNFIDRNHTENVKKAISTLYEDRLIAEVYILKMTSGIYQIKGVINTDLNEVNKVRSINNLLLNIKDESNAYQKTKFTEVEKNKADELLNIMQHFESIEVNNVEAKLESANKLLVILNELSAIQFEESKKIMDNAEELYISGKTSSKFVFIIIILILLVLQAIVFASKTLIPVESTKPTNLN